VRISVSVAPLGVVMITVEVTGETGEGVIVIVVVSVRTVGLDDHEGMPVSV
jgi:hypothetical protein